MKANHLMAVLAFVLVACAPLATAENHSSYEIETVVEGLNSPWGMTFLPDGRMLVTVR